jgi:Spy/CpxP family protein refolding chaperone
MNQIQSRQNLKRRIMKKGCIVLLTVLVVGFFLLSPTMAQGPGSGRGQGVGIHTGEGQGTAWGGSSFARRGMGGGFGMGVPPRRVLEEVLGFTEEQFAALDELKDEMKAAMQPIHDKQIPLHDELREALKSESPDPLTVGTLTIEIHNGREESRELGESFAAAFKDLLTEDQLAKLEEFEKQPRRGFGRRGPRN